MMQYIEPFTHIDGLIILLTALASIATVFTLAAPLFATNKLAGRIKAVASERDRLKTQQKTALDPNAAARLRDKKTSNMSSSLVDKLNLKKVFSAEKSVELLRNAGLRKEQHMMAFLAMRAIAPLFFAFAAFTYMAVNFSTWSIGLRMAATVAALVVGFYAPGIFVKNMITKRQFSIKMAWSDALDLLLICVESGMALEPAMQRVAKEIGSQSVPLAEEMDLTTAELAYLPERRKALENLAKRTGLETVKSVVTALIQSERYGTPLGTALRVLAEENRKERMSEAEKRAAALPPKLTVPMILFFLPVIFVVILGPSVITVMQMRS